jgi:DNA repair protein RadC
MKPCAKALLDRFGSLRAILDAPVSELQQVAGIGEVGPVALRLIRETATLYLQQQAEETTALASPDSLTAFWRSRLGGLRNEVFEVAYLDSAFKLIRNGVETLEEGTVDRAAVYPRRVIEAALRRGAAALVCAHNHPNGDVRPSDQDKVLTRALVLAANTVQLKLLDHLIVSAGAVFSFRKEGLM